MSAGVCTIPICPDWVSAGVAMFTPIGSHDAVVLLVSIDERAAKHFGIAARAASVLGGVSRVGRMWSCVAYTDRDHLLNNTGDVWHLPDLGSRATCARALARWWHLVDTGQVPRRGLDPVDLSTAQLRYLTR